jgi:methylenetetrahydrofolate dehydrogenase (NADP+)/methenyltetrahydrofolate cyclohydrolase
LISPMKDPDGFTYENLGLMMAGRTRVAPCTPEGVIRLLKHAAIELAGLDAVVVGRSNIVGKPMGQLLLEQNCTVTMAHSKTRNLKEVTRRADLVVIAAGRPRLFGKDDFKKDAIVVDVGIHKVDGKLCGDVRFEELEGWARAATPVPGGVGPMTISLLLENTLKLAELREATPSEKREP